MMIKEARNLLVLNTNFIHNFRKTLVLMTNVVPVGSYHINDHFSHGQPLLPAQVLEDITVFVLHEFERHGQVVILQHRLIIVHQGKLRTWKRKFNKNLVDFYRDI